MSAEGKSTKDEIQRNRNEAYQGGWGDGYAEGFGKATDLSQASVAAALEAAAELLDSEADDLEASASRFRGGTNPYHSRMDLATVLRVRASNIRALITDRDRDALDAHVAAEVAKARAEDAAWLPVEDAPQDGTAVITIKSNGDVARGAWYQNPFGDENTFIDRASGKWWTAVGWLPMPKAIAQIGANP